MTDKNHNTELALLVALPTDSARKNVLKKKIRGRTGNAGGAPEVEPPPTDFSLTRWQGCRCVSHSNAAVLDAQPLHSQTHGVGGRGSAACPLRRYFVTSCVARHYRRVRAEIDVPRGP